jgi:DNA-binding LytR/AlgR family response regulator
LNRKFAYSEIKYFQSLGNYIKIFTEDKSYLTLLTMTELEANLVANYFVRIHKSYIVPIHAVKESWSTIRVLINNEEIPIGRTYIQSVKNILEN